MPDLGAARASVDKQSMRGFLAMVERDYPDELVRISQNCRSRLEPHVSPFAACTRRPALFGLFHKACDLTAYHPSF
jgi:hypothetical protein